MENFDGQFKNNGDMSVMLSDIKEESLDASNHSRPPPPMSPNQNDLAILAASVPVSAFPLLFCCFSCAQISCIAIICKILSLCCLLCYLVISH